MDAGWGFPGTARKAHYFHTEEITSVCGRWMYSGPREPETGLRSRSDCVACVKVVEKMAAADD